MAFDERFVSHIITNYKAPEDAVAFDIGANLGKYTKALAGKFKKVYAFEACPATCESLKAELYNAKITNVEIVNKAIVDKNMDVHLFTQGGGDGKNRGGNTTSLRVAGQRKWGHKPEKSIIVPGVTLDDYMKENKIENLRFIKMDIEGGEDFAWFGAEETLKNNYLDIVLEVHNEVDYARLHKYMTDQGYKFFDNKQQQVAGLKADTHYLVTNRA